jgi:hypothetical protein
MSHCSALYTLLEKTIASAGNNTQKGLHLAVEFEVSQSLEYLKMWLNRWFDSSENQQYPFHWQERIAVPEANQEEVFERDTNWSHENWSWSFWAIHQRLTPRDASCRHDEPQRYLSKTGKVFDIVPLSRSQHSWRHDGWRSLSSVCPLW